MLRAKMDLRSIVTYLSMKGMNAREIYTGANDTLGADCIGDSTVTKYSTVLLISLKFSEPLTIFPIENETGINGRSR
jgi:hypothetical protein